jgi:hypothetical protein
MSKYIDKIQNYKSFIHQEFQSEILGEKQGKCSHILRIFM